MRRASHHITLVLLSSTLIVYGCRRHTPEVLPPPAGQYASTLPGNPTTYRYIPPYYYPARGYYRPTYGYGTGYYGGYSGGHYGGRTAGSSSSSDGWGSSQSHSSRSTHVGGASVSRGGFGSHASASS